MGQTDGHSRAPSGMADPYRYNALNRLTNLVVLAGAVTLGQFDSALGATGQRDKLVEHVNGAWRTNDWKYDGVNRTNRTSTVTSRQVLKREGKMPATVPAKK